MGKPGNIFYTRVSKLTRPLNDEFPDDVWMITSNINGLRSQLKNKLVRDRLGAFGIDSPHGAFGMVISYFFPLQKFYQEKLDRVLVQVSAL